MTLGQPLAGRNERRTAYGDYSPREQHGTRRDFEDGMNCRPDGSRRIGEDPLCGRIVIPIAYEQCDERGDDDDDAEEHEKLIPERNQLLSRVWSTPRSAKRGPRKRGIDARTRWYNSDC